MMMSQTVNKIILTNLKELKIHEHNNKFSSLHMNISSFPYHFEKKHPPAVLIL